MALRRLIGMPIGVLAVAYAAALALAIVGAPALRAAALDAAEGGARWADALSDGLSSPGIGIMTALCCAIAVLTLVVSHQQLRRDALEDGGRDIAALWGPVERVGALAAVGVLGDVVAGFVGIGMQPLWLTWPVPGESPLAVVPTVLVLLTGPVLAVVALVMRARAQRASLAAAEAAELERRSRHSVVGRRIHEPDA
ncbi:hypothetical protein [Agrococcus sp. HG114]|uniref:hypothetical protein n=1 Tax=Agrococcus sp. HG114 TaxID=2969757 RepID=UPI00215B3923|nr:hypothetical protein [Agrococcus sp. HG114]MCR8672007.1 hypothetical protein [Agrococcus sp. HG114]